MEPPAPGPRRPGAELLVGAVDCHVHACPHLNGRSLDVLQAVEDARAAGVSRILTPCSHFEAETVAEIAGLGALAEFSFFFASHATQVGLSHVDAAKTAIATVTAPLMALRLHAVGADNAILSSDCGVFLLPPPVEGLREFLLLMREAGFSDIELRRMSAETPARLFRLGSGPPKGS